MILKYLDRYRYNVIGYYVRAVNYLKLFLAKLKSQHFRKLKQRRQAGTLAALFVAQSSVLISDLKSSGFKPQSTVFKNEGLSYWIFKETNYAALILNTTESMMIKKILAKQASLVTLWVVDLQFNLARQLALFQEVKNKLRAKNTGLIFIWNSGGLANDSMYQMIDIDNLANDRCLRFFFLNSLSQDTSGWGALQCYYALVKAQTIFREFSFKDSQLIICSPQGLGHYVENLLSQTLKTKSFIKQLQQWLIEFRVPGVLLVMLLFSWQANADYHHNHHVSYQLKVRISQLKMADLSNDLLSNILFFMKSVPKLHTRMLWDNHLQHLMNSMFKMLIQTKTINEMVSACFKASSLTLGNVSLRDFVSLTTQQWLEAPPLSKAYLKHFQKRAVRPCIKVLWQLHYPHRNMDLTQPMRQQADVVWLQWFSQLNWKAMSYENTASLWPPLTREKGDLKRLLQLLIAQYSKSPKSLSELKSSSSVFRRFYAKPKSQLVSYWQALALVETNIKRSLLQTSPHPSVTEVIHILHDPNASLQAADYLAKEYVASIEELQLKSAVLDLLRLPLVAWWQTLLNHTENEIDTIWHQTVWSTWQADLKDYFPFAPGAEDVSIKAMEKLFEPHQGALAEFNKVYFKPFMTTTENKPLLFLGKSLRWDPEALVNLSIVQQWSHYFFQDKAHILFSWDFYPLLQATIPKWLLVSGQQRMIYHNGPRRWHALHVPNRSEDSDTTLSIQDLHKQPHSFNTAGPWSLWRLIRLAHVTKQSDQRYRLTWYFPHPISPGKMEIQKTQILFNPHTPPSINLWQDHPLTLPATLFTSEYK